MKTIYEHFTVWKWANPHILDAWDHNFHSGNYHIHHMKITIMEMWLWKLTEIPLLWIVHITNMDDHP